MIPFDGQTFEAQRGRLMGPEARSLPVAELGSDPGLWDSEASAPLLFLNKLKPHVLCPELGATYSITIY